MFLPRPNGAVLLGDVQIHSAALVDRLVHYFLTYKTSPRGDGPPVEITEIYGPADAHEVIRRSAEDYAERFGSLAELLEATLHP